MNASLAVPKQTSPTKAACSPIEAEFAYLDAVRKRTSQALREFIAKCPDDPLVARARAIERQSADDEMWKSVAKDDKFVDYERYLSAFPDGLHAEEARGRAKLKKQAALPAAPSQPPAAPAPRAESAPPQARFIYHDGVDFGGDDLNPANPILFNQTLDSCANACQARADCRAFTFNRHKEACFLKSGTGRQRRDNRAISAVIERVAPTLAPVPAPVAANTTSAPGIRILEGYDLEGGDLNDHRPVTIMECAQFCGQSADCRAFSYVNAKNWCFLKRQVHEPRPNASVISVVKP